MFINNATNQKNYNAPKREPVMEQRSEDDDMSVLELYDDLLSTPDFIDVVWIRKIKARLRASIIWQDLSCTPEGVISVDKCREHGATVERFMAVLQASLFNSANACLAGRISRDEQNLASLEVLRRVEMFVRYSLKAAADSRDIDRILNIHNYSDFFEIYRMINERMFLCLATGQSQTEITQREFSKNFPAPCDDDERTIGITLMTAASRVNSTLGRTIGITDPGVTVYDIKPEKYVVSDILMECREEMTAFKQLLITPLRSKSLYDQLTRIRHTPAKAPGRTNN